MHVAPAEFRSVRRDGVVLHFAALGEKAWVVVEFPASGSAGTFAEAWCERPHWGVAMGGDVTLDLDAEQRAIAPGTAFHVPAGVRHRFVAGHNARVAGLETLSPDADLDDAALRSAGFEPVRPATRPATSVAVVSPRPGRPPEPGEIIVTTDRMGELLLTRSMFGRRAGYASEPCDQPHWGLVTMGSLALEWEDDVEVLSTGDVYYCMTGPPGHRLQAAEAAATIDFTPVDAFRPGERVASWRARAAAAALRAEDDGARVRLNLAALG